MAMLQFLVISVLIALSAADGMISRRGFAKWKALRGFARNSVFHDAPPTEPPTYACVKSIDLGIVMEKRTENADWNLVQQFVSTLVSKFPLNYDMTHIGAIGFDQRTELLLKFDDLSINNNYKQAVLDRIKTWGPGHASGTTYDKVIDKALQLAGTELFTYEGGARGYDQVLLLLTDGKQTKPGVPGKTAASLARELEQQGVKIIVVGIGLPDPMELWDIAGSATPVQNVFYLRDASVLEPKAEEVANAICSITAPGIHSV